MKRRGLPTAIAASAAVIGGACWSVLPLLYLYGRELHSSGLPVQHVRELLPFIAVPLLLIGVGGLHTKYHEVYSPLGRGGIRGLGVGILILWPFGMLGFLDVYFDTSIDYGTAFLVVAVAVVGLLIIQLGSIGVGVEAWKTDVPSRWMGLWFPALLPASIFLNYWLAYATDILPHIGGHLYSGLFGIAWIGVGYHLFQ